jgi:hypothetical protein
VCLVTLSLSTVMLFGSRISFFGLFGIYYSLRYLSLSDATVLTFLAPLCTAISGALFLKENFRLTQALAGSKCLAILSKCNCLAMKSCQSDWGHSHCQTSVPLRRTRRPWDSHLKWDHSGNWPANGKNDRRWVRFPSRSSLTLIPCQGLHF